MKRVEWTDAAIEDLNAIKTYLSKLSPHLADDGVRKLILSARWLCDFPYAGPLVGFGKWRKWKPKKQRYILIYQPVEKGISIVRVRHERNDWRPVPE
jgi:plasmid stabilization system protein ParE